jgi:hypothetical protein
LIPEIKFVFLEFIQSFGLGVIQLMLGTHTQYKSVGLLALFAHFVP